MYGYNEVRKQVMEGVVCGSVLRVPDNSFYICETAYAGRSPQEAVQFFIERCQSYIEQLQTQITEAKKSYGPHQPQSPDPVPGIER